jgi:hypothetical protein
MEKENSFHVGDIIWAKIRGYAWWPAKVKFIINQISRIEVVKPETKFSVRFIGDDSHAVLPEQKIKPFLKEFSKLSNTKMKRLQVSIQMAKDMLSKSGKTNSLFKLELKQKK